MKFVVPCAFVAAAALVAVAGTLILGDRAMAAPTPPTAQPAPAEAGFWSQTRWDDDHADHARYGPMPRPSHDALRRVGVVRVLEVERDDGRMEIEGLDAQGREIDILMDIGGQRVLASHVDRHSDDHHDDDRWDD